MEKPPKVAYAHYVRQHPTKGWQFFSHSQEKWLTTTMEAAWPGDVEVSYESTKDEPEDQW